MRNLLLPLLLVSAVVGAGACGGSAVEIGGYAPADSGAAPDGAANVDGGDLMSGSKVAIHLRASTAPVAHSDGLSGQTPSDQKIGIRKLTLLKSASDPSPLVVFDHGAEAVEAGLNDKDDTVVATVAAKALQAGTYKIARVGISHVRYRVAATMHAAGQSVPGTFDNLQVLSDGSNVDGATRNKGHFRFTFEVGGNAVATQDGESGPLPETPAGGGITLDTTGTESAYVFPVNIPVDPSVATDVKLVFAINTHENLRWQDESSPSYQSGVLDVTPTAYEPVKSFGANSFQLILE